jgi:hypothetical protein
MTEYQIVNGWDALEKKHSAETLAARVQHLIREGWTPQGGIAVYDDTFFQAMVR